MAALAFLSQTNFRPRRQIFKDRGIETDTKVGLTRNTAKYRSMRLG